jgi:hypothetical protein
MKTSTLAECLEEYAPGLETLRLTQEPATRVLPPEKAPQDAGNTPRAARRIFRAHLFRIRDEGFRPFRVY